MATIKLSQKELISKVADYCEENHKKSVSFSRTDEMLEMQMEAGGPMVYILHCQGFYKIGQTNVRLQSRIDQLQMGNPFKVELVMAIRNPNYKALEKQFHQKFSHKRKRGEWFALEPSDFKEIEHFMLELWQKN